MTKTIQSLRTSAAGSLELPLPEDTEATIVKAKEIVEAAESSKQVKRKAEDIGIEGSL
jgi:hypothetical protein